MCSWDANRVSFQLALQWSSNWNVLATNSEKIYPLTQLISNTLIFLNFLKVCYNLNFPKIYPPKNLTLWLCPSPLLWASEGYKPLAERQNALTPDYRTWLSFHCEFWEFVSAITKCFGRLQFTYYYYYYYRSA